MKKVLLSALASSLFILSACSSEPTALSPDLNQSPEVSALAASSTKLSMNKTDSAVKKNVVASKLKEKAQSNVSRKAVNPDVSFKASKGKNDFGDQSAIAIANFALQSMNSTSTWDSGANIGYQALNNLMSQNVYVAKLAYSAAQASTSWEESYKIIALGLSNIANQAPNTPQNACELAVRMMDVTKTYDSGAKVGYALLSMIGSTDNMGVRNFVSTVYNTAQAAYSWQDSYNTINNGLKQLRNMF